MSKPLLFRHILLVTLLASFFTGGFGNEIFITSVQAITPAPVAIRYRDAIFTNVKETPDVTYKTVDGRALKLDIFEPSNDSATNRPFVVIMHGGGLTGGDRKRQNVRDIAKDFAQRGYVAASIEYRLSDATGSFNVNTINKDDFLKAKDDVISANQWLKNQASTYKLDPEKNVFVGTSMGGILALYAGYDNRGKPDSIVSSAGTMIKPSDYPTFTPLPYTILLHGTTDTTVPYQLTVNFHNYLENKKIPHLFLPIANVAHEPGPVFTKGSTQVFSALYQEMFLPALKLADLNKDNKINIFDYNMLLASFGKTGTPGFTAADINKDGKVSIFDYNVLVQGFGII